MAASGGHRVRPPLYPAGAGRLGKAVPGNLLIEAALGGGAAPANSGNALQSLVSRLRAALRQAGLGDQVVESHPAGYRLAVPPEQVDAVAFEALAAPGQPGAGLGGIRRPPAACCARPSPPGMVRRWPMSRERFATAPAARLEELRRAALSTGSRRSLALARRGSLIGELRELIAADPLAERSRAAADARPGRRRPPVRHARRLRPRRELLASELGVDPAPQLEQVYLGSSGRTCPVPPPCAATAGGRPRYRRRPSIRPRPRARPRSAPADQLRRQG